MVFYGILLALISSIFGQFLRFEIGGGGVLFLDIFLPLLFLVWGIQKMYKREFIFSLKRFPLFWEGFLLITVFAFSLFVAGSELSFSEFVHSGFYLFRYLFLILFGVVVYDELSRESSKQKIFLGSVFLAGGVISILGCIQLYFYPDFTEMAKLGWDPHIGRLLSTWFDPNFVGGFFSFLLVLLFGIFSVVLPVFRSQFSSLLGGKKLFLASKKYRLWISIFLLIISLLLCALFLTFSRSALLVFVVPVFFLGILYFRKILFLGIVWVLFLLPFSERGMQRVGDGLHSALSVTQSQSLFLPDATARLRLENYEEGLDLAQDNLWMGVGFNTIRFHRSESIHSSGGFDSSLLTVLVTTGIGGLFVFLWFHFFMVLKIFHSFSQKIPRKYRHKKGEVSYILIKKGVQRGFMFSFLGVFAQSFFVNALFFPLFLLFFFGILGYCLSEK